MDHLLLYLLNKIIYREMPIYFLLFVPLYVL